MVSGLVTDTDNEALIGASISIKGTSQGTITDIDGRYNLSVNDPEATLVFSFVGYGTQEMAIQGRTNLNATLTTQAYNTCNSLNPYRVAIF